MRLEDKVIIITGGGSGMGRAYALGVAAEGARVVVADIADPQATVKEIEAGGGQALGIVCDVSREEDTLRLAADAVARFGRIDVLVNNAALYGTLRRQPFTEIPIEEWDRVMAVNLRGLFLCARAVFPAMKAQGKGKIINISSGTFFKGVPNYIHYTTSKGGVIGFTRSLARELGDFGVRVNAVAPGFTLSGENELHISTEEKEGQHPDADAQASSGAGRRRGNDRLSGVRRQRLHHRPDALRGRGLRRSLSHNARRRQFPSISAPIP